MIRETVVIRGVEYRVTAQKGGLDHPRGIGRLVSMVRVNDNKVIWGKI